MSDSKSDPRYTMGRSEGETERLIQQSQLYEAVTLRFFQEAGLVSGMRVLDVGSGAGDVAMAAAELVGAEGEVVGCGCQCGDSRDSSGKGERTGL